MLILRELKKKIVKYHSKNDWISKKAVVQHYVFYLKLVRLSYENIVSTLSPPPLCLTLTRHGKAFC